MNFNKRVSGSWEDVPHYVRGTSTDTLTLPQTVYADGTSATLSLKGNTETSGTPSPSSPVTPNGTGERTGNLWSNSDATLEEWISSTGEKSTGGQARYGCTFSIPFNGENSYSIKYHGVSPYSYSLVFYDSNGDFIIREHIANPNMAGDTITVPTGTASVIAQVACNVGTALTREMLSSYSIMLDTGSTALPYEPYGIKIPILNNSTTYNKYLGEEQTVRQIKKLVLDGTENWNGYSSSASGIGATLMISDMLSNSRDEGFCTHFATQYSPSQSAIDGVTFGAGNTALYITLSVASASALNITDTTSFKTYLQQQYAAGTPVTVWYVLATPTTGITNEPLMKIGSYSDSLSTSIPTTDGANALSVGTTVQPSETTMTYHGWHPVASAHERENGQWD